MWFRHRQVYIQGKRQAITSMQVKRILDRKKLFGAATSAKMLKLMGIIWK
jgi:hypothetical protein